MDTLDTTYCKDLLGTFIADLVLSVMSYTAQMERENIRQRQAEGIAAAKAKGIRFGRPRLELPEDFDLKYEMWHRGLLSVQDFADYCGLSRSTLYLRLREYQKRGIQHFDIRLFFLCNDAPLFHDLFVITPQPVDTFYNQYIIRL